MEVRIVGAHNIASRDHRLGCVLIDGVIALDAGSLSVGLTFREQQDIESVFVTHRHYDHVRDLLTLGLANVFMETSTDVYGVAPTISALREHLLNGQLYPDPTERPSPDRAALRLHTLEPLNPTRVGDYEIVPIPVNHAVEAVSYEITNPDGRKVFYSGDTGPGVTQAWWHTRPDLMLLECTLDNAQAERAETSGHLVPRTFGEVLSRFRQRHGYLPDIVAVHIGPFTEDAVRAQLADVGAALGISIRVAREDDIYRIRSQVERQT